MKITVGLAVGFLMTSMLITLVNARRPASPMAPAQAQGPSDGQQQPPR